MHASNVQIYAIDAILEGVNGSRRSKTMKIKRKSKRRRQNSGRSRWSLSIKSTPRKATRAFITTDGERIAADLPGLENWPLSGETSLVTPRSDVPRLSENLASGVMSLSEVNEALVSPTQTFELVGFQAEEGEARLRESEERGTLPPLSNLEVNPVQPEPFVGHPVAKEFSDPAKFAVKNKVPELVNYSREEKGLFLITEDDKASVPQEEEQKSLVYPTIVRPTLLTRPEVTSDTIVISEKGGEEILKILNTAKEPVAVSGGKPMIIRNSEKAKLNIGISETDLYVGIVNKFSKTKTDGFSEPKREINTSIKLVDLNEIEHNANQSIDSMDGVGGVNINLSQKVTEMDTDFEIENFGPSPRTTNELDVVWQKFAAESRNIALNDSKIKRHFTRKEMPTRDIMDETSTEQDTDSLKNETGTKTKSIDLETESDQKSIDKLSLLISELNESIVKKAVWIIDSQVNLSDIREPDDLRNYLVKQSSDINMNNPQMKYLKSIRRITSNPISTSSHKSEIAAATKLGGRLKRTTGRPRPEAKQESWQQHHPTTELKIGRSKTSSDKIIYDQKNREKSFASLRKARLKTSDIEEAKLKAALELASKQPYPDGTSGAKKIKQFKF